MQQFNNTPTRVYHHESTLNLQLTVFLLTHQQNDLWCSFLLMKSSHSVWMIFAAEHPLGGGTLFCSSNCRFIFDRRV